MVRKSTILLSSKYIPSYIGEDVVRGVVRRKIVDGIKIRYFLVGTPRHPVNVYLLIEGKYLGEKAEWVAISFVPVVHHGDVNTIEWKWGAKKYQKIISQIKNSAGAESEKD